MSEAAYTLNSILWSNSDGPTDDELAPLLQKRSGKLIHSIATRMVLPAGELASELSGPITEMLAVDLGDILAGGWRTYRRLQDAFIASRAETVLVPLAEHDVTSIHRPHIELLLNDTVVGRIEFEVQLSLELEGVVLKLRDERVVDVLAGRVRARGSLACEGIPIVEHAPPPILLREVVALPGLPRFPEPPRLA